MHAFVAASPAFAFQMVTASPPAATARGSWVNTAATRAKTTNTCGCGRITNLFMISSCWHWYRHPLDVIDLVITGRRRNGRSLAKLNLATLPCRNALAFAGITNA